MESNTSLVTNCTHIEPLELRVWLSTTLTGQCQRSCSCPRFPAWVLQQIFSPRGQQTERSGKGHWMNSCPHCHGRQIQTGMGSASLHLPGWLQWQQGGPGRDLEWSDVGRRVSTPPGCPRCQHQSSCSCGPSSLHSGHWDLGSLWVWCVYVCDMFTCDVLASWKSICYTYCWLTLASFPGQCH